MATNLATNLAKKWATKLVTGLARCVIVHGHMTYYEFADAEHIKRERRKAQELRKSSWWKQQIGKGVCYHCGQKFTKELLTMDHLVPVARGGKSSKKNCVVSCKDCNTEKGHQMSVEKTIESMNERGEFGSMEFESMEIDEADIEDSSDSDRE